MKSSTGDPLGVRPDHISQLRHDVSHTLQCVFNILLIYCVLILLHVLEGIHQHEIHLNVDIFSGTQLVLLSQKSEIDVIDTAVRSYRLY